VKIAISKFTFRNFARGAARAIEAEDATHKEFRELKKVLGVDMQEFIAGPALELQRDCAAGDQWETGLEETQGRAVRQRAQRLDPAASSDNRHY